MAVLSNNGTLMAESIPAIVPALFADRAFCSASLAAKPSPVAYLRCLDVLAGSPAPTVFVDDSAANVAGAREAGLVGHRFVDLLQLRRGLRALGLA